MSYILNEFGHFVKEYPYASAFNLLLSFTSPIDDIFVPYLLGLTITNVQSKKNWITPLTILIVILVGMQIIYTMMYWHDGYLLPKAQSFLHQRMVQDIIKEHEGTDADLKIGEILSRIVRIPLIASEMLQYFKNYIIPYIISFAITTGIIFRYDKVLGWVVLATAIILFTIVLSSPIFCMTSTKQLESAQASIDEETEDLLQNISTVYAANKTNEELRRLDQLHKNYEKSFAGTMDCVVQMRFKTIMILTVMMIVFAVRSIKGLKNKTLAIGSFVTIVSILGQWFGTLGWIASNMKDIVIDWGILDSFEELRRDLVKQQHTQQAAPEPQHNTDMVSGKHKDVVIATHNLSYYIGGRKILDNVNIQINKGERIALIGEIGSGKSTLCKMLLGLKRPTSGAILINGKDVRSYTKQELRKMIGYVPQNPTLFNRTIIENIKYGTSSKDNDAYIVELIDSLGLSNALLVHNDESNGLKGLAGKRGSHLSGGQRQLIACIRALITNPPILILDEITSSIDAKTKSLLFNILNSLFEDKTVIMITHDRDLLSLASRTISLSHPANGSSLS